ncbi:hypothetical protein HPP92_000100 [Vanilla planifolia]|uniref:5'-3' exonuclease domain-containing protein n=1 Tax=Vanilla planifolia TaxID=51239 RepID=A0A835SA08_VANPL|nr:hypothetical protein HPP92_000100 [Vanilla planifolia]
MSVSSANACSGYHPLVELTLIAFFVGSPLTSIRSATEVPSGASTPSSTGFRSFFSEISHRNPVIAVLDGEDGNEFRRKLLPSYKSNRQSIIWRGGNLQRGSSAGASSTELQVTTILQKCNVPVIKVNGYEADDVVATLTDQAVQRGHRVVIGSPDKDFKQLISQDVHIVMPLADLGRWSFYTMRHYIEQYKCDPSSDLSLRCIIGDEVDGVPGIQYVAPKFGRKTALKLLRKHGSLANLLKAAAVRTVGKQYAQDALTKHADYLWRNFEVLGLRRYQILELGILKLFLFKSYIPWPFYQSSLYIQWRHGMLEFTFKRIGCWRGILPVIFWCYQTLLICWIKQNKAR